MSDVIGRYESADALALAVRLAKAGSLRVVETYTPTPMDQLEPEPARVPLARLAAAGGVGGSVLAYAGQWLIDAYLYPLDAGARPPHMPLAFLPIALEMGFLCAAVAVVLGFGLRARLTALWEPVCDVPGFTYAGYWLVLRGHGAEARAFLARTGATEIAAVGGRR